MAYGLKASSCDPLSELVLRTLIDIRPVIIIGEVSLVTLCIEIKGILVLTDFIEGALKIHPWIMSPSRIILLFTSVTITVST